LVVLADLIGFLAAIREEFPMAIPLALVPVNRDAVDLFSLEIKFGLDELSFSRLSDQDELS
jgi:hypothetical protein